MTNPAPFAEIWRGPFLESVHSGHAVICDSTGQIVDALGQSEDGDPAAQFFQDDSGAAFDHLWRGGQSRSDNRTTGAVLRLASEGAAIHTDRVAVWLETLGLSDDDFRCGPQEPNDTPAREALIRAHEKPCQIHNNCSGKHAGFLTWCKHSRTGPEYVEISHPLQRAIRAAVEELTELESPGYGYDGCSAPNFATTVHGLARAATSPGQTRAVRRATGPRAGWSRPCCATPS